MPPKAGRRRATRLTARKSAPPPPLKECSTAEEQPEPQNDAALEPEADKSITDPAAEEPPAQENSADPVEESPAQNDAALDAGAEEEVAAPQSDVVMGSSSETLAQPEEPVNEVKVDNNVSESGKEVVSLTDKGNTSNGGKAKKVVKKMVKVVKKVIKKVPKKVAKGGNDAKVDNLAGVSNPNSTSSVDVEADDLKQESASVQLIRDSSVLNVSSTSVEVEEEAQKIEVNENKDDKEKGSGLMEVDNNEGGLGVQTDKGVVEEWPAEDMDVVEERKAECGKEDEDLGEAEGKEEDEEVEDDAGNVAGREDEVEEGKLFRGELEAMERRKRRKTEIFIGGLDKDAKEEDVRKVFAEAGEIVDLRVVMNAKTGKNKGFAFLRYASAADAKRALEKFAKVEICGKQCAASPVEGNDTLFLGNIDKKWKDEDILKLLLEIGIENIDKVTVMVDPNNSECNRGFAFVELETSKDAQIAYKKLQKKDAFGKNQNVKVAWAEPLKELDEEEMLKVKTVYAEFIPSSWDEEKVRDTFKKFGEIDDIVLARNLRTTKRKDFAFVSFKTREAAIECIESFSRELTDEDGTKVNVKVSLAKPMQKSKRAKPAAKTAAKEIPRKKQKASHSSSRPSEPRNRAHPIVPRYDMQIAQRSSTNSELVHLLREQASWRPSHASLSNSPMNLHYSNSYAGRKRQFSMLEVDPLYPDSSRYPYSRLDASFPVASSSHNAVHPSGLTSPMAYHQQHGRYPSGSHYGPRNYQSNIEIRDKPHGSSNLYRRY